MNPIIDERTPAEKEAAYRAYREDHTVTPGHRDGTSVLICTHDGFKINRRAALGGWQHDPDEVREARQAIPAGWPK